jgi:hypothetical protein
MARAHQREAASPGAQSGACLGQDRIEVKEIALRFAGLPSVSIEKNFVLQY